jgi:hypothetical protein
VGLSQEQIMIMVSEAIKNRTDPPMEKVRAKYAFWIDLETKEIYCSWASNLRLKARQRLVINVVFNPDEGFTGEAWREIARKFAPYFIEEEHGPKT